MLSFGFIAEAKSHVSTCLKMIKKSSQSIKKPEPISKKSGTKRKNPELIISKQVRQKIYYLAGQVNLNEKNREKALEYFQKSHDLLESLVGKKDIMQLADSYLSLGNAQLCMRGLTEVRAAEHYYNKAKEIILQSKGENHISMAGYFEGMALCSSKGNLERDRLSVFDYTNKVCGLRIAHYGESHPVTAKQGKRDQGLEYYNKALNIDRTTFGELHEATATDYLNIAGYHYHVGNDQQSIDYYNKVLDIALGVYGEDHPLVAMSYVRMGDVYKEIGDHDKAAELKLKGYQITVKEFIDSEEEQKYLSKMLLERTLKGKL